MTFQHEFSFLSTTENTEAFYTRFLEGNLDKIYQSIPWDSLAESFGIKEKFKDSKIIFSPKNRIGLMLLKHHAYY